MKTTALALSLVLGTATAAIAVPAAAQSRGGVGVVDLEQVVQGSSAYAAALSQINTTYAQNIQQYTALQQQANTQLQPLVTQARAEQAKPQPNPAQLQTYATQIQQIQQQTQAQLAQLGQPIEIARAYVGSQISDAIKPAVDTVARNRRLSAVVSREAALFVDPASDVTADVVAELNRTQPQVGIVPPPEWLQARGVGQPGAQPTAAPVAAPTPQPQGR